MQPDNEIYDYSQAGFSSFLTRSIDDTSQPSLAVDAPAAAPSQQIPFDRGTVSGAIGDKLKVGNIEINGVDGRISIYDGEDEVTRIGKLDD